MAGATVMLDGGASATTDADGRYTLPSGGSITVLHDGYGAALGTAGTDVVLAPESSEVIELHGEAPAAAPGAAELGRSDLERLPGAGNDMMRSLQAMPGVVSTMLPTGDSGVVIRGSSPQDSKILVDGFEVPVLYHDLGFRSIVPAEAIDKIDYIPGGFDVGYGRATSGIVDVTTRAGDPSGTRAAELSAADGGVIAQGKSGRVRYMLAFRRSVIDQLLPLLLPKDIDLSLTTVPRYYDEQVRIDYALSSKWTLRVSSLGSDDVMELYASRNSIADKRFYDRTRFIRVTTAATYHDGAWTGSLALSGILPQTVIERGTMQHVTATAPAVTGRGELQRTFGNDVVWRLGGEVQVTRSSLDVALPEQRREGEPPGVDDPMDTSTRFSGTVTSPDTAAWTSIAGSLDARVHASAGLRVDAFARTNDYGIEPRGDVTTKLTSTLSARVAAGAYRRPPEYQTELLDPTLGAERATQLIGGLTYQPDDTIRVQGSLYYTDRSHLITRVGDALTNDGRGTTYGAELLATARRGRWFGWLSYSYSHSTRVDEPGGMSRLFDYDQPHSLNIAASYRWDRWQLGGRFRLYSGLPQTPVLGAVFDSDRNIYIPIYGPVNSERAPIHHQLDVRIDRHFHWGPLAMTYFLDIQNVYMNQSTVGYIYGFDYQEKAAFRSLPILPTAGLRGEF